MTEHTLKSLSQAVAGADGRSFAFNFDATDGTSVRLRIEVDQMPDLIHYLCTLAGHVRQEPRWSGPSPRVEVAPLEVLQLGLMPHTQPELTLLVARLAGLDLAFQLDSTQIASLGRDFARMAQALSAAGPAN